MESMDILLEGDGAWPDLQDKPFTEGKMVGVAVLENGTANGLPAVIARIELPNGETVIAQTTLRLFGAAADAFRARHPDPGM